MNLSCTLTPQDIEGHHMIQTQTESLNFVTLPLVIVAFSSTNAYCVLLTHLVPMTILWDEQSSQVLLDYENYI